MTADARKRRNAAAIDETRVLLTHWQAAVPADRLAHLVRDAARLYTRALADRLAEHDVPFGHWSFLRILWDEDGLTQRELSAKAGVMDPTTHAAMSALEKEGCVERRHLPADRRSVYVHLTPKGRALREKLVPLAEMVNAIGVEGIPAEDLVTARRVLLAIIENLAHDSLVAAEGAGANGARHRALVRQQAARAPRIAQNGVNESNGDALRTRVTDEEPDR
jgi:DNA-binding MarR family transcriptional regulator